MTANLPAKQNPQALTRSLPLPSEVWRRMGEHEGSSIAVTALPATLAEHLPAALDAALAELAPPQVGDIDRAISMIATLPAPKGTETDGEVLRATFHAGLSDIPADLLREAAVLAIRNSRFRPSPAEMRGYVADQMCERRRRLHRLEAARRVEVKPEPEPLTPEQQVEFDALRRRFGLTGAA
jgi:hypothetical protein